MITFFILFSLNEKLNIQYGKDKIDDNEYSCENWALFKIYEGTIEIPGSVEEIGANAFTNCYELTGSLTIIWR